MGKSIILNGNVLIPLIFFLLTIPTVWTKTPSDTSVVCLRDSVSINFNKSKWDLDRNLGDNSAALAGIRRRLTERSNDSVYVLRRVNISGGASPEGSVDFNRFLSEHRAATLFEWIDSCGQYGRLADTDKTFTYLGRDWEGVLRLAELDTALPCREETLDLLSAIVREKRATGGLEPKGSLQRIKALCGGKPYAHLYKYAFPAVRASKVVIDYERVLAPEVRQKKTATIITRDTVYVERIVEVRDTIYVDTCKKGK